MMRLLESAHKENPVLYRSLVRGANVNERFLGGSTMLMIATILGHIHSIKLLIQLGAD